MATDNDFAALAERLTDPATHVPKSSEIATGTAAAAQGRALMVREFGSDETLGAELRRAGS